MQVAIKLSIQFSSFCMHADKPDCREVLHVSASTRSQIFHTKMTFAVFLWCFAGGWSPAEDTGHLRHHVCPDILQDVDHVGIF